MKGKDGKKKAQRSPVAVGLDGASKFFEKILQMRNDADYLLVGIKVIKIYQRAFFIGMNVMYICLFGSCFLSLLHASK